MCAVKILATELESVQIQHAVGKHAVLLSIVLAMLAIRVEEERPAPEDRAVFQQKLAAVGEALESLQNCSETPPLSKGAAYITDQMAVIKLPQMVKDLFGAVDCKPEVLLHPAFDRPFFQVNAWLYDGHRLKSGITFKIRASE